MSQQKEYVQRVGRIICERLAYGELLSDILKDEDLPCRGTLYHWVSKGKAGDETYEQFYQDYEIALELQADALIDEALKIADAKGEDADNRNAVTRASLQVNTRFRTIEKKLPKKYGQKLSQEITGGDGKPIAPILSISLNDPTEDRNKLISETEISTDDGS